VRIEQLEYFAAVTQHGSLRRASERLHISQPALSEAISKLERELGVTLLDRRRSGAHISQEGRQLLQHVEGVLEAVDQLTGSSARTCPRSATPPTAPRWASCWWPRGSG
jgi:DNA-binding transcriptional LysR family regulator